MVKVFPRLVESLRKKLPARTVKLVPGEYFFAHSLDLPPGILPADIHSLAEFSLESLSPFGMDQLSWGFIYLPGAPSVLLYAAYRDTLVRNGFTELEANSHVYPAFVVGTGSVFDEPTVEFKLLDRSLSAVGYAAENPVPQWVSSVRVADSDDVENPVGAARERLLKSIDASGYTVSDSILEITGETVESNDGSQLFAVRQSGDSPEPVGNDDPVGNGDPIDLKLDELGEWYADIRDSAYIRKRRKEHDLARKVWYATLAAGAAAAVCLLLQIGFFSMGLWIQHRAGVVVAQTEAFLQLSDTQERVEKIEQFVQEELRPFEMLETMNVERPSAVHFTEADAAGFNRLSVKGIGTNVTAFNRYTEALRLSPRIEAVEPQVRTSQGRALFTLTIIFKDSESGAANVVAGTSIKGAQATE